MGCDSEHMEEFPAEAMAKEKSQLFDVQRTSSLASFKTGNM